MSALPETKALDDAPSFSERLSSALFRQEGVLVLIGIVALVVLAFGSENFLTVDNLLNQTRFLAEIGLIALPMTYIIITGGIDLSVGAIVGVSAIMLGVSWQNWGLPLELAIVVCIITGVIAGLVNGLFIVRVGVPPLIMTLATLALYRGLAEGISESRSVRGYPDWFEELGQGSALGLPTQLWVLIIFAILFAVVLARTTFGRSLYAIGNNELGARFSGIPVGRNKLIIYSLSGLMAGIAAWIFVSRTTTTRSDYGSGWELDVIAAVVLGGTSIFGGTGTIIGTMLGIVLIQLLKNGLALTGVTSDATIVIIGSVLILSILINNYAGAIFGALTRRLRPTQRNP
jgi:rhamnose transport system permease protein